MMKRGTLLFAGLLVLLPLFFLIQESRAGVIIEEIHRDLDGRMVEVARFFSESQFRTDHSGEGRTIIIDFKGDRMVMIDHLSRSYVEIKFSRWEKEVSERLKKSMPEIKRKERRITVRGTGERAVINGFQTEKVEIRADGQLIEENWMTRDADIQELEKVMEKVAKGFSKGFQLEMKEGREIYQKLKSYGIPVLIRDYTLTYGLGPINVMEIQKIEKKELKGEVFLPPPGYQRIIPQ
ncbi:MAG: DUF4412 domain-containing protein [Thermodesulfobacteriota bacterium]|nr:DUF4412 domain-containing protein [Thermodesulfobacteriota bacterium]